jgi:exopolysaccharide production protein ExoZ
MRKVPPYLLLDAFRGFAALGLVIAHACVMFLLTGDNNHFSKYPLYAVSIWGQLGVVIFFVISGYCIMGAAYSTLAAGRTAVRFGFDRIRRIYPPYLIACAVDLAITFATTFAQNRHLIPASNHPDEYMHIMADPQYWLANLFLLRTQSAQFTVLLVTWTLFYQVAFYIVLGALLLIAITCAHRPASPRALMAIQLGIGCLTFISLVWLIVSPVTCQFPVDLWYQFGIGALLFFVLASPTDASARTARVQLVFAGILTFIYAIHDEFFTHFSITPLFTLGHPSDGLQAMTCLIFTGFLWVLRPFDASLARLRGLRPLMWLGTISYSLYLFHAPLMSYVDAGGRRLGFDQNWYWVTYLAEIVVGVVSGWLFYLAVERHFIFARQKRRIKMEFSEEIIPSIEPLVPHAGLENISN